MSAGATLLAWLNGTAAVGMVAVGAAHVLFGERLHAWSDRHRLDDEADRGRDRSSYRISPRLFGFYFIGLGLFFSALWLRS